jgi:hypothetical protein
MSLLLPRPLLMLVVVVVVVELFDEYDISFV